jgi:hypothetical protein
VFNPSSCSLGSKRRLLVTTVLVVEGDPVAVREALSRSGFAVRDEAIGTASGTVMAVTSADTVVHPGGLSDTDEQESVGLSAAAILARAGLSGDHHRSSYPPRSIPAGW